MTLVFALFQDSFDAANAGGGRFFFFNFEVAKYTGVFDVWATTNFAGNWIVKITNGVDFDFIVVFIPEHALGMKLATGIFLIESVKRNGEVGRDPFVYLVFYRLLFFWSKFTMSLYT